MSALQGLYAETIIATLLLGGVPKGITAVNPSLWVNFLYFSYLIVIGLSYIYTYWIPFCWLFVRIILYSPTCNSDASSALSTKTQPTWTTGMISRRRWVKSTPTHAQSSWWYCCLASCLKHICFCRGFSQCVVMDDSLFSWSNFFHRLFFCVCP